MSESFQQHGVNVSRSCTGLTTGCSLHSLSFALRHIKHGSKQGGNKVCDQAELDALCTLVTFLKPTVRIRRAVNARDAEFLISQAGAAMAPIAVATPAGQIATESQAHSKAFLQSSQMCA